MAFRASQAFTSWIGGTKRRYKPNDLVPDEVAEHAPLLVYDDGAPKPTRRASKKSAASDED